jgi:heat shock protein HslJ
MINFKSVITAAAFLLLAVSLAACSRKDASQPAAADAKPAPAAEVVKPDVGKPVSELAGTSWRLVKIMEMDDSVDEPEDRSLYTLEFGADGRAAMRADCNRGTGTWTSEGPKQLQFGPIASTKAMCPPGSLSDKYLAQFQWVRSYVMENGHIFLATMADGSIIEFEPAPAAN